VAGVWYFVSGFWRELQKFIKMFGLQLNDKDFIGVLGGGGSAPPKSVRSGGVTSRPRTILSSACLVRPRGGGGACS
jgi:hypothetical protein